MSNNEEFLDQEYKIPTTSNYMKFQNGANRFRFLAKPIIGWQWWVQNGAKKKPVRAKMNDKAALSIPEGTGTNDRKHFWAMVVWNYQDQKVQVLEITQKGIMKSILALSSDPDWGHPFNYDIVVTKEGEGKESEYQTNPKPKTELNKDIKDQFESKKIDLNVLYEGGDPFGGESSEQSEVETEQSTSEVSEEIDENELPF